MTDMTDFGSCALPRIGPAFIISTGSRPKRPLGVWFPTAFLGRLSFEKKTPQMSGFAFPPPKSGGLPAFPGLGGPSKGGLPDFSAFAKPRESAVTVMPEFANKVPKKAPPTDNDSSPWDDSEAKKEVHIDTTVATFTCTHKQWQGQLELGANGQFTRIGKDGGTWRIEWEPQRETDDGDKSGELVLDWSKWGAERLRTVDGARTFKHEEYLFECELLAAVVPKWLTEELLDADDKAAKAKAPAPAPAPKPRADSANDSTWQRGQTVADPEEAAAAPEPEAAAPAPAPTTTGGARRPRLQFAMPSRQERAAALVRKYSDIGVTMANMDGAEPTEIVAFLKKSIGDLHQIGTLTMKYKRTVNGVEENREGTPAEILGMPQSALDEMRKARLIRYLENDDEKRIKVLLPVVEQAYEVMKPFLVSTAASAEEVRNQTLVCPVRGIELQRAQLESNMKGKQFAKKAKALAAEKAQNLLPETKVKEVESVYGVDFWAKWTAA